MSPPAVAAKLWQLLARDHGEDGQGVVEYAIILILVAMVVLLLVMVIGKQTGNLYSNISSGVGT